MNAVTINDNASTRSADMDHAHVSGDASGRDAMFVPQDDAHHALDTGMVSGVEYGRMDVC